MKRQLLPFLLACAICFTLQSCDFGLSRGVWRNKTIDQDLRDEIGSLNKKLFKNISTGNTKGVKQLMSEAALKQNGERVDSLVKVFSGKFKVSAFSVLDEFYIRNRGDVTQELLRSNHENGNDYQLQFVAINRKTYASLLVTKGAPVNCLILAIYGKYENGWKINMLEVGDYSVMDQTAPEYYQLATDKYAKGQYVDAYDMIVLTSQLARPAGKFFYYLNHHEMADTYSIIVEGLERNYKLPLIVTGVKTQPQIFRVTPQVVNENDLHGVFPLISYLSHIPLKDTVALRAENLAVQNTIGSVFSGVDKNKPCIVYRVFNQLPNDTTAVNYYQFLQRIKYSTRY